MGLIRRLRTLKLENYPQLLSEVKERIRSAQYAATKLIGHP